MIHVHINIHVHVCTGLTEKNSYKKKINIFHSEQFESKV